MQASFWRARSSNRTRATQYSPDLHRLSGRPMEYNIFTRSSGVPLDTVEMHVLARAYRAAWRSVYLCDPAGPHVLGALDVLFVFVVKDREPERES